MKKAFVVVAALAAGAVAGFGTPATAFGVKYVTEDPVQGFIGQIPTSVTPVIIASDGEAPFHPFGITFDVSDAISLNGNWAPDPAYAAAFGPGGWQQLAGTSVWYIAACDGQGVCENGKVHEPIGKWDFTPGGQWGAGAMSLWISDPDGKFSDLALIANDGPGGEATVKFVSDGVPEPAAWALMLLGMGGIGYAARRRRTAAAI